MFFFSNKNEFKLTIAEKPTQAKKPTNNPSLIDIIPLYFKNKART